MTSQKYIIYRNGCAPFDLCSSQILFYWPVSVKDNIQGNGFWSLQQSIGGVDFGFQSCLLSYPYRLSAPILIWMLEAWSKTDTSRPAWTTSFSLPFVDITTDDRMTELSMDKNLNAEVVIRDLNGVREESAAFKLPRSVQTELKSFSLTTVGAGDGSAATFQDFRADIKHDGGPLEVNDLLTYGIPAPDTDPPFPCPIFTSFEGSNATQTLTLNNGNQVNLVTDLTPRTP